MSRSAPARVAVDLASGRARITDLCASRYLGPRPLDVDGRRVRVALVGICATLLAGDDLRIEVDVGTGAHLELIEPSGTVAYDARGGRAEWNATVRVAPGGSLIWAGAPFVVAHGADVCRHTRIDLEPGATMLLRETLVLGRSSEDGGRLRASLHATYDNRALLVEDLDLRDSCHRTAPGVLGDNRVLATATLLGIKPEQPAGPYETALDGPGALARALTAHSHLAQEALAQTWRRWQKLADDDR